MTRELRFLCFIILSLFSATLFAQVISEKSSMPSLKQRESEARFTDPYVNEFIHFDLELLNQERDEEIRNAIHHFPRIENYRFVESRRRILLSENLGYVILYSAQELKQNSGRSIRPQNIRDMNHAVDVTFVITKEGVIKEQLITKN